MILKIEIVLLLICGLAIGAPTPSTPPQSTRALIKQEREKYQKREKTRKDILGQLDSINAEQNKLRQSLEATSFHYDELSMALDNMELEVEEQKQMARTEQQRLKVLLRVLYQADRDGVVGFVLKGKKPGRVLERARLLYRTVRMHERRLSKMNERLQALKASEAEIAKSKIDARDLLSELKAKETDLEKLLKNKQKLISSIDKKQSDYRKIVAEYKNTVGKVSKLISEFEKTRPAQVPDTGSTIKSDIQMPISVGKLTRKFGKDVNEKFDTVVYHKGIEIEAPHNTPVSAVSDGVVEYSGWLKGMGNVIIVHHDTGFYSLSGYLYKANRERGERVKAGDTIGYVGDTGRNPKPSLYFEIREKSKAINPLSYYSSFKLQETLPEQQTEQKL